MNKGPAQAGLLSFWGRIRATDGERAAALLAFAQGEGWRALWISPWNATVPRAVRSPYAPPVHDGGIVVYAGELAMEKGDVSRTVPGEIMLRLGHRLDLSARFSGPLSELLLLTAIRGSAAAAEVAVCEGASLAPPAHSTLDERPEGTDWVYESVRLTKLAAGDFERSKRFVFHVVGAVEPHLRGVDVGEGVRQPQFRFEAFGWALVFAAPIERSGAGFGWID